MMLLAVLLVAGVSSAKWVSIFSCSADLENAWKKRFMLYGPKFHGAMSDMTGARICSGEDCVTAKPGSGMMDQFKKSFTSRVRTNNMQPEGMTSCDMDCVSDLWEGPESMLQKMTWSDCTPTHDLLWESCGDGGMIVSNLNLDDCAMTQGEGCSDGECDVIDFQVEVPTCSTSEWETLYHCNSDYGGESPFSTQEIWNILGEAVAVRICTDGDDTDCVTSTDNNDAIADVRNGIWRGDMFMQPKGVSECDEDCVKSMWTGSDKRLRQMEYECDPHPSGPFNAYMRPIKQNGLYVACGTDGLRLTIEEGDCTWEKGTEGALEVQLEIPTCTFFERDASARATTAAPATSAHFTAGMLVVALVASLAAAVLYRYCRKIATVETDEEILA